MFISTPWPQTSETDSSGPGYCQTDFLSCTRDDNHVTQPHPINTKQAINPTNHESTVELAGSRFASNRPPFWQQSLLEGKHGTSGGSRQALALHGGRTSAWKLHYVPAVGFAVALSKNNLGRMMLWQIHCRLFEATLFGAFCREMWAGAMNRVHECFEGEKYQHVLMQHRYSREGNSFSKGPWHVFWRVSPCFFWSLRCVRNQCLAL